MEAETFKTMLTVIGIMITIFVIVGGWIFFFGKLTKKQEEQDEKIKENKKRLISFDKNLDEVEENLIKEHRKALYGLEGITIYLPRKEFVMERDDCQDRLCRKIEEVKDSFSDIKKDVKEDREKQGLNMEKITLFMGTISQGFKDLKEEIRKSNGSRQ